jgi:hypothetical protein
MNQHAATIATILANHAANGTYWWNSARNHDQQREATAAKKIVEMLICGHANRFKDFIFEEYIDDSVYDEEFYELSQEAQNNIATYIHYAKLALEAHREFYHDN